MILNETSVAEIKEKMVRYPRRKSAILPALTVAYHQVGHLNDDIYDEIASIIDIPAVEIAEAATFYTMFPKHPVGKYLIQVCHNISCALLGADSLVHYLEEKLGIKKGETTPDNVFTLITVECLGSCASAPMMQINDQYYEFLTREKVDAILDELRKQA
ncbi:MAG: NADH-quinone oxidoreductase subunit NuoE [candidate division Zixibacteria bacterium]|nr:NADH-quinone oxidoreductase subunit NuoE [candidate division Zixibacteria bacterium]